MQCQHLEKIEDVIEALGGIVALAELTDRGRHSVYGWRSEGRFPPATYRLIMAALADRGLTASIELWAFEQVNRTA